MGSTIKLFFLSMHHSRRALNGNRMFTILITILKYPSFGKIPTKLPPISTPIFICPRLLAPYWCSDLYRAADLIFEIPAEEEYWLLHMHEPLILAISLPCLSHRPWHFYQSPYMVELGERLQRMFM
jgi:hypothetical protein